MVRSQRQSVLIFRAEKAKVLTSGMPSKMFNTFLRILFDECNEEWKNTQKFTFVNRLQKQNNDIINFMCIKKHLAFKLINKPIIFM